MADVFEIMDMLDWQNTSKEQCKGIELASQLDTISVFIQPVTPRHNKNVWENCAKILSSKSDECLDGHIGRLFEWLQDMNWPGAEIIFERLTNFPFLELEKIYQFSRLCAQRANDEFWLATLDDLEKRMK